MTAPLTVLSIVVVVDQGEKTQVVEIAAGLDRIQSPEAARTAGRMIGEALSENLERRLRHGEILGVAA